MGNDGDLLFTVKGACACGFPGSNPTGPQHGAYREEGVVIGTPVFHGSP